MDTARYRAFLTAAETGSIRNAADVLGYTSSGVSQLIKSLEEDLQLILFFRGKKGVTLTSAGEMVFPVIHKIVSQENHLMQLAADLNGTVFGTVNVDTYHSLAAAWMPEIISAFQQIYPEVRINLFEGTQQDIVERLLTGRSDVAIFNDSAMSGKYDWIPLKEDPMLAVVPITHPMAQEEVFPIEKFEGERFIMPEHGYDFDVMRILAPYKIKPDIYLSTFDSYIVLEMVEKELGISMVNGACMKDREQDGKLKALPLEPPNSLEMGIAVISLKDAAPAVLKFIEYTEKIMKEL
ncbi:LysR family transcriptional regulator [Eubacterium oxidoreducens]|uniref:DNA-binding transcriptional regulator, LysR family n=1 Tax=Eubacterium oxidoreducens TaxID=1732 RepID=A0A1G6B5N2_EUBOX|nr:LysR family transcriptional regulator [Eubacterium oxidoreducens]SDB15901.1 DNA-binding transcriptional regulator, LysR family [Eubacterium oxidoreducens]